MWVLSMEFASCHFSGTYCCVVAPRFLKKLSRPVCGLITCIFPAISLYLQKQLAWYYCYTSMQTLCTLSSTLMMMDQKHLPFVIKLLRNGVNVYPVWMCDTTRKQVALPTFPRKMLPFLWVKMSSFQNTYEHQHSVRIHKLDIHQQ